ncbi:MAG: hypothetical protein OXH53_01680 [bacterium]|nr:hypothetical protein [bacterium]
MRKKLALDDDVADLLQERARQLSPTIKHVANDTLCQGVSLDAGSQGFAGTPLQVPARRWW